MILEAIQELAPPIVKQMLHLGVDTSRILGAITGSAAGAGAYKYFQPAGFAGRGFDTSKRSAKITGTAIGRGLAATDGGSIDAKIRGSNAKTKQARSRLDEKYLYARHQRGFAYGTRRYRSFRRKTRRY